MSKVTRREFMRMTGIVLAGSHWLSSFNLGLTEAEASGMPGRTLAPLTMTGADGAARSALLPDSVIHILGTRGDHFAIAGGFVPRELVQPMTIRPIGADLVALPFLAEVCAPVAAIRASCAADAPLLARIGHAGTATVRSRLSDGRGGADWYEIETSGLVGWSQSMLWTPVDGIKNANLNAQTITVDRATQTLTALEDGKPALQALVSVDPSAMAGSYTISGRQPSGPVSDGSGIQQGAPWLLQLEGGYVLGGSTWHNRFGTTAPGMLVQVPPQIAKWLYRWMGDGSRIVIH